MSYFFYQAVIVLLRGLVISAVLGLESSYSNDMLYRASDAAIVATTGKRAIPTHTVA
jgi:hypothetical protein